MESLGYTNDIEICRRFCMEVIFSRMRETICKPSGVYFWKAPMDLIHDNLRLIVTNWKWRKSKEILPSLKNYPFAIPNASMLILFQQIRTENQLKTGKRRRENLGMSYASDYFQQFKHILYESNPQLGFKSTSSCGILISLCLRCLDGWKLVLWSTPVQANESLFIESFHGAPSCISGWYLPLKRCVWSNPTPAQPFSSPILTCPTWIHSMIEHTCILFL